MLRRIILYSDIYTKQKVYEFIAHSKKEVESKIIEFKKNNPGVLALYVHQELVNKQANDYEMFNAVVADEKMFKDTIRLTEMTREK